MVTPWDAVSIVATAVAAIMAALATIAAWRSVKATEKSSSAQVIIQLTDSYASEEMLSGMMTLQTFKNRHKTDFARAFDDKRRTSYPDVKEEDEARRRYSHHFHKIYLLYATGLVDKTFVSRIVPKNQVEFLLEVIEPLEDAIGPDYDRTSFDFFHGLYPAATRMITR